ncbi:preprotein translocase subunit Sec61beta [Candidatus Woesearchaeota archaeon]|nr:preprotein translocase subunit Sec61beta [Candidatus Woesearchaeota archaeon]
MADDNKVYIPASSGGVVTYYKDSESKIKIDPNYIVIAIVVILILEFILHQSQIFLK